MKLFLHTLFASLFLIGSVTTASAEEAKAKQKELNPWVDCGIGAMLFKETEWAAVSSNIIWDLGTTAVTSNVSSQETCESKRAKTAMFVGATYANLEEETVKGQGQHLHAMLNMLGCKPEAHSGIINSVRVGFGEQLNSADYAEKSVLLKSEEYYGMVKATIETKYSSQCQVI